MKPKLFKFLTALIVSVVGVQMYAQTGVITGTILQQPCNNDGQLAVSVTGMAPPLIIVYNYGSLGTHTVNAMTDIITGVPSAQYYGQWSTSIGNYITVEVTDVNNHYVQNTFTFSPAFTYSVNVSTATCPSPSTLEVVGLSGGTMPYSYQWTDLHTQQTSNTNPLYAYQGGWNTYSLTVTDGNGCTVSTQSVYLNPPQTLTLISISGNTVCPNNNNLGYASITSVSGGVAPYTYLWSNGATTPTANNLTVGSQSYYCTVTDAQGCSETIYAPQIPQATVHSTVSATQANCTNGTASITPTSGTSPYTYLWSNGSTTSSISGLVRGIYTYTITDVQGCVGINGIQVNQAINININTTVTNATCLQTNGGAYAFGSGGVAPYTYLWSNGVTTQSVTGLSSDVYYVIATDANGCTASAYVTITQPATPLSAVITSSTFYY